MANLASETQQLLVGSLVPQLPNNNDAAQRAAEEKQRAEDEAKQSAAGPFGCFVWLCNKSTSTKSKCEFIGWIILGILGVIFYGVYLNMDSEGAALNYGYFLCAALSLILSCYATFNFQNILSLKEVVDKLVENSQKLDIIRSEIQEQVGNLLTVRDKLAQIEEEQSIVNAKLRAQEKQFREWSKQTVNITKSNNKQSLKIKKNLQIKVEKKKREIKEAEVAIMFNALKYFEKTDDDEDGLNKIEFVSFINVLPKRYRDRWRKSGYSFEDFSGGDDIIDTHKEFRQFLNEIIDKEVSDLANGYGIDIPGLRDGVPEVENVEIEEEEQDDTKDAES